MKKILISSALVVLLSAVACDKKTLSGETSVQENLVTDSTSLASGFLLLETNCFSCHGAESKVAPSMTLIKETYLRESGDERAFRTAIANFLKNPSEAYKIPEAVRQFGMMPKMNLTEKQIQDIVHYLSTAKIEKSDWFEREYPVEKKKYTSLALSPIEQGQQWAMQARGVLGKKLLEAIQSKGIEEAISFCSTKALFLTDSVAQALQVNLKRVSDKYRNPANAANETELALIEAMKKKLAN
ncbi:MAG: DUF3365 domain-containing protein, partial [Flammeovirgaceae bacterium]|nr:DUF3365 domain-containing protein [Flammeovirgaceae bacterium]MDW8288338.1 DUF3365 domain-containing protein [Flammeovirgaceae bacterium]